MLEQLLCPSSNARSNQAESVFSASSTIKTHKQTLKEFINLYDAFYTDANKTALKNSQFDKLEPTKDLADKLEGSREYTLPNLSMIV